MVAVATGAAGMVTAATGAAATEAAVTDAAATGAAATGAAGMRAATMGAAVMGAADMKAAAARSAAGSSSHGSRIYRIIVYQYRTPVFDTKMYNHRLSIMKLGIHKTIDKFISNQEKNRSTKKYPVPTIDFYFEKCFKNHHSWLVRLRHIALFIWYVAPKSKSFGPGCKSHSSSDRGLGVYGLLNIFLHLAKTNIANFRIISW
jgi:hypothetical protein